MNTLGIVLLVAFIIVCVLLVLLVVIQDDGENGMGGLLGGRGTAAFGSHSASVLTKTTRVFVFLFFGLAVALALVTKKPAVDAFIIDKNTTVETTVSTESAAPADWWNESKEAAADAEVSPETVEAEEAAE